MSTHYPLTNFHFSVEWGGSRLGFTEVSGLEIDHQVIEYREGSSPLYSTLKLPGMAKYANVTLKRGIVAGDNEFFAWLQTIQLNAVERRALVIHCLNEQHEPVMSWKLRNAWPVRLVGPTLDASSGAVAIETLEVAHEGIHLSNN